MAARRRAAPARATFAAAEGEAEFLTEGVMAPTRAEWRELKLAVFLRRPAGETAEPQAWATRKLPGPSALVAYAEIADCDSFSAWWGERVAALGIDPAGPLTVLGDGAAWTWAAEAVRFPAAAQVLNIFHAGQHIAATANSLHGEWSAGSADRLERGWHAVLADGWPGLLDHIGATPTEGRTAAGQAAADELIGYFARQTDRVGYYGRPRSGRPIGSGAVEALARRMGCRLKVSVRGWCVENLDGMAALIWAAPRKLVHLKWKSLGKLEPGGTHEQATDRRRSDSIAERCRPRPGQGPDDLRFLAEGRRRTDHLLSLARAA